MSHGLFFSQRLLLALVDSGLARDEAYRLVQRHAMRSWEEELDFPTLVRADAGASAGRVVLDAVFDLGAYTRHVGVVFRPPARARPGARPCLSRPSTWAAGKCASSTRSTTTGCCSSPPTRSRPSTIPTEVPDSQRPHRPLRVLFARTGQIVPNHLLALRDDGRR